MIERGTVIMVVNDMACELLGVKEILKRSIPLLQGSRK